jgi:formylglycine-generating enzyme required for sulfatase activity
MLKALPRMVRVPAGEFVMGSPIGEAGRLDVEGPQHTVKFAAAFEAGAYAVTVDEFADFAAATGHPVTGTCQSRRGHEWQISESSFRDPGFEQTGVHPVVCVSWDDAQAFIRWLSAMTVSDYRLLTEAEWEYCARAGTTTRYSWGDCIVPRQANYRLPAPLGQPTGANAQQHCTAPVTSFAPNPWGLFQMHGNVWEWVEDCYVADYFGAPTDGTPRPLEGRDLRVLRGGSWNNGPNGVRSARRHAARADFRRTDVGFRLARSV